MAEHHPLTFVAQLGAKLATRSRHVCVFLGAGAARACGLPDIAELQERVLRSLNSDDRAALNNQLAGRNLEKALSRLRRIAALLDDQRGDDQLFDGLSAAQATALDAAVCHAIVQELDIERAQLQPVYRLAAWVKRAGYSLPVELFTVNYDLLLETALEELRVPYFDGFLGILRARFHTELVEAGFGSSGDSVPAFFVRLWKLHGSVNWAWQDDRQIVRLGQPVAEDCAAAIYPSDEKYEESRRVPFVVLQDRLRRALQQSETMVIISGYAFADDHLNELIFDAAARHERSEFVAFCYAEIPEALAERAGTTPNLQVVNGYEAILGGVRGKWKAPEDPPPGIWENCQFALRDFENLARYLSGSVMREPEVDAALRTLVGASFTKGNVDTGAIEGD